MAGPSTWPFWTSASLFLLFFGMLIRNGITVGLGAAAIAVSMIGWHAGHLRPGGEH